MGRKITTYLRPSLIQQIKAGLSTVEQVEGAITQLETANASPKTIRRARKALAQRIAAQSQ